MAENSEKNKRRIAPTFMLPQDFPDSGINDIYFVFSGGISNILIASADEFRYTPMIFAAFGSFSLSQRIGIQVGYRIDDEDLHLSMKVLDDLVNLNSGFVDWTMVLQQGQRAFHNLSKQLACKEMNRPILRFTKYGRIYLPERD